MLCSGSALPALDTQCTRQHSATHWIARSCILAQRLLWMSRNRAYPRNYNWSGRLAQYRTTHSIYRNLLDRQYRCVETPIDRKSAQQYACCCSFLSTLRVYMHVSSCLAVESERVYSLPSPFAASRLTRPRKPAKSQRLPTKPSRRSRAVPLPHPMLFFRRLLRLGFDSASLCGISLAGLAVARPTSLRLRLEW